MLLLTDHLHRALARSALPNAPVLPDTPARRHRARRWLAAGLRLTARLETRAANRLHPARSAGADARCA